ncbi:MAG: murein peptide amidase A [Rhodoferax sp.]|nr:murein peptide amidase A [Betaproteobacteria bacterium]NCN96253.1 murein peptide amidase A [Rhodoferax sp.]PIZ23628.1 MAG: murein peptide amidase A [Comamonadaceae bacterium CG_4_10_14_0_8_um_filter_57_29]PJC14367.1 MAG: murein peptide amidase A [Comamonadaceae bacterium CG_4_9_14_0_8_um_filter_57_21]NCP82021.1 murein peptide amidase A [Rhodoferax sp.]
MLPTLKSKSVFATFIIAACAFNAWACGDFYKKLPNVSATLCASAQLTASGAHSVQGRALLMRDITVDAPKLRVLVVAAMHGDEFSSASVALHWLALAQTSPDATDWRFIPVLNPDGLMRRPARRMNANGVDLNRNFPTPNWQRETKHYWEKLTRKDPRRWPGKAPLSEPESKFLFDQMASFKPDVIVSIHAPYGVLDFDGPVLPPTKLGRLYLDQVGVFPGSLGNYGGVQNAMPVVTVELPSALRTPTNVDILKMWRDLRRWMDQTQLARR